MKKLYYILTIVIFGIVSSCHEQGSKEGIAYDGIKLEKGLRLKLIASEPLVHSPVAFAFDEQGYLDVVEDIGYPDSSSGPPTHEGRIVRLEDRDGDGVYDHETIFATGFTYPNGILPWRGGVFVTCAPDIFYLKDTTGDGVADERKVVLTGFNVTESSQLRVSTPVLGMDGWVYIACGLNGGKVVSPEFPGRDTVAFTSSDGRFNPDDYTYEVTGGNSEFGLSFDDFGRRFGSSNRSPIQQIVMEPRYLNRNPYLPFNETIQNVSKVEGDAVVYPISNAVTTSDYMPSLLGKSHKGTFTSACSNVVFGGNGMKPEHIGNVFICEPAQNLVQRQKMIPDGVAFRSVLTDTGYDFLASTDPSFRPVFLGNGPDGGLYVADMYRAIIDEPEYIPADARDKLDYRAGKDKGRIYEVINNNRGETSNSRQFLKRSTPASEVLEMLKSENEWSRQTAFRLLLERKDKSTIPLLTEYSQQSSKAETRVLALWLLHSLHALNNDILLRAFKDHVPEVREQAVELSASKLAEDSTLKKATVLASKDSNERVRFESALALGSLSDPKIPGILAQLAIRDGDDRWMRAAIFSGIGERMGLFFTAIQRQKRTISNDKAYSLVMEDMGKMFGNGASVSECGEFLRAILQSLEDKNNGWCIAASLGMANGLTSRPGFNSTGNSFIKFIRSVSSESTHNPKVFINEVIKTAKNQESPESVRTKALELLGFFDDQRVYPVLEQALQTGNSPDFQKAAIEAITHLGKEKGGNLLAGPKVWHSYTPEIRQAVINALVSKELLTEALMDGIEDSVVAPSDVPPGIRQRLMDRPGDIQERAKKAFANLESGDRMKVFEKYKSLVIGKKGNAKAGQTVFLETCSRCHTYAGKGGNVGPDLTDIKDQPTATILLNILLPNYVVYPQFQTIYIETKDGQFFAGWIVSQTNNSTTLRTVVGDKTIFKSNIKSSTNTGNTLMPVGLEKSMTTEGLINLLAYLKSGGNF